MRDWQKVTTPAEAAELLRQQGIDPPTAIRPSGYSHTEEVPFVKGTRALALKLLRASVELDYTDKQMLQTESRKKLLVPADGDETAWDRAMELMEATTVARRRLKPDVMLGTFDEWKEYDAQVRHDMAKRLKELKRPARRKVTLDGIEFEFKTSQGVLLMRRLANHQACRLTTLCDACAQLDPKPLACRCKSPLQRWVWRLARQLEQQAHAHRWVVAYIVLILEETVQHWHENRIGLVAQKDLEPRLHTELKREAETLLGRPEEVVEEFDDEDKLVSRTKFTPSDGTSRLAVDLRGWDRPTSMGRRTQRMAFCPTCAEEDKPWFLVGKKVPFGSATCNHMREDKECGTTEITPPPRSGRIPTYTVLRYQRMHGKVVEVRHDFYRKGGRWTHAHTNEQVHTALHFKLEQKWLAKIRKPRSA